MKGFTTALDTEEHQTNPSVPQQEEQGDAKKGKVIADKKLNVDHELEWADHEVEPVHHEEEKVNSNAEYAKKSALIRELQGRD